MEKIRSAREKVGHKAANVARGLVSKKKLRYQQDGYDLDLAYINARIIAMGFPVEGGGLESKYRNPMPQVVRFLEEKHRDHYKVYNLCPKSERDYNYDNFHGRVSHFPFEDHNPPLISTCIAFCEDAQAWMDAHPDNVIAVHCKAGKGRTGCMIGCFLQHSGEHPDPNEALTFYGKARVSNGKGVTIPSQARYVRYYSRVLRNEIPAVLPVLRLDVFRMHPVPSHMSEDSTYFVVCQNDCEIYNTSKKVVFNTNHGRATPVDYKCRLEVCGDITIEVFDKKLLIPGAPRRKSRMFQIAFHTAFIEGHKLSFTRAEIDKANKDPDHFPENFRIEVLFSPAQQEEPAVTPTALQYLLGPAPVLQECKFREYLERNFLIRNPNAANRLIADAPRVVPMISVPEFITTDGCRELCGHLNFRTDTAAIAETCESQEEGLVYELEIAKGELVGFPTRVFVQASSIEEICVRVGSSLKLFDSFGKVRDLELTIGDDYELVTSMSEIQVRTIVAVWTKDSKLRADLQAAAADPSMPPPRDPKGTAYTTVGEIPDRHSDSAPVMSTGDQLSPDLALAPEPEAGHKDLSRKPDAATEAGDMKVGCPVEVYSRSMQKWMQGTVVAVEDDGKAIKVKYSDNERAGEKVVDPTKVDEVRRRAVMTYSKGEKVMIYSRSLSRWVSGEVLNIETNGDINVIYGSGDAQRTKCVDPADTDSVRRADTHTSAEEAEPPSPKPTPSYAPGDKIEVYSTTLAAWVRGSIVSLEPDGLKVTYGDGAGNICEKVVAHEDLQSVLRPITKPQPEKQAVVDDDPQ